MPSYPSSYWQLLGAPRVESSASVTIRQRGKYAQSATRHPKPVKVGVDTAQCYRFLSIDDRTLIRLQQGFWSAQTTKREWETIHRQDGGRRCRIKKKRRRYAISVEAVNRRNERKMGLWQRRRPWIGDESLLFSISLFFATSSVKWSAEDDGRGSIPSFSKTGRGKRRLTGFLEMAGRLYFLRDQRHTIH